MRDGHGRDEHCGAEPIHSLSAAVLRDAVAQDDVRHEQRAVDESEDEADGLIDDTDVREHVCAANGQSKGKHVPSSPRAERGERDRPGELDRADGAQREAGDRQVKARVHRRQHDPKRYKCPELGGRQAPHEPPGSSPQTEDKGRAGDAQPGNAQHINLLEEEDCKGRAEVVKNRADQEERVRGDRSVLHYRLA